MPMTTLQKGKHRNRRFFAIFYQGVIILVYFKIHEVRIELYTDFKDLKTEQKVEAVLDAYGIFYNKTETWIDSEKLYEVLYSFELEGEINGK